MTLSSFNKSFFNKTLQELSCFIKCNINLIINASHFASLICRYLKSARQIDVKLVTTSILILAVFASQVQGSCRRRFSVEVIQYNDCQPKRLLTYRCDGTCTTHAQMSLSYPFNITHTCYQCKETDIDERRVKIKCPNTEGPSLFKDVFINVHVPKRCMCQLCNDEFI